MYLLKLKTALFALAAAALVSACATDNQLTSPADQAAPTTTETPTLTDGIYKGFIRGSTATLTISDGVPVAYDWDGYVASDFDYTDGVVEIDDARLTVQRAGDSTISGIWSLQGTTFPVTLTRN